MLLFITLKWRIKPAWAFMGGLNFSDLSLLCEVALSLGNVSLLTGCHWMTALLKFMGRDDSGSVCFVLSHKSCWRRRIYQFPLPQKCCGDGGQGSAGLCCRCCVQSVSDRLTAASICAPCHYKSVEDNAAAPLHHVTTRDSDHDSAVRWTEACSHFLFTPEPKREDEMGMTH